MNETPNKLTEKKRQRPLTNRLSELDDPFVNILRGTCDGIVILTETGVEYANPAMSELLGVSVETLQTPEFDWTSLLTPEIRAEAKHIVGTALETSLPVREVTFLAMTKHRNERCFTASLTPVPGDVPRLFCCLRDISDHIKSANEWEQRTRLLEEIGRANRIMLETNLTLANIKTSLHILQEATYADRLCIQMTDGRPLDPTAATTQICVGACADLPQIPVPASWRARFADKRAVQAIIQDLPSEERQPLEAQGVQALLALPMLSGDVCWGLMRFDKLDNDILWSENTIMILQTAADAWGSALALVRSQAELENAKEQFERLVENSRDMIYRMSIPEGEYEYVSPASLDITGYTPEDFLAHPKLIKEIIHPGWWNYLETQWSKLAEGDMPPTYEYAIIHGKTGETRWIFQRNAILRSETGTPIAIEGIVTDVTARKRAEMALHTQESMLRSVFHAAPIGIGILSDRVILQINDYICQMLGYTADELVGQNSRMLYPTEADYNHVGDAKYEQIRQHGTGEVKTRWQKKDGSIIQILLRSTPLEAQDLAAGVTIAVLDLDLKAS